MGWNIGGFDVNSIISPITSEVSKQISYAIFSIQQKVDSIRNSIYTTVYNIVEQNRRSITNILSFLQTAITSTINSAKAIITSKIDYMQQFLAMSIGGVSLAVSRIVPQISGMISGMSSVISNTVGGMIRATEYRLATGISSSINRVLQAINNVKSTITNTYSLMSQLALSLPSIITNSIQRYMSGFSSTIINMQNFVTSSFNTLSLIMNNTLNTAMNTITNRLNQTVSTIQNISSSIMNILTQKLNSITAFMGTVTSNLMSSIQLKLSNLSLGITEQVLEIKKIILGGLKGVEAFIKEYVDELKKTIEDRFNSIMSDLYELIAKLSSDFLLSVDKEYSKQLEIFKKLSNNEYGSIDEFMREFDNQSGNKEVLQVLLGLVVAAAGTVQAGFAIANPFVANLSNLAMSEATPTQIPPGTLPNVWFRNLLPLDEIREEFAKQGFDQNKQDAILNAQRPFLSPGDAQVLFMRGSITEEHHDLILSRYGYEQADINQLKTLYYVIPPLQDIITMAVRETFSPEVAEKFGQFDDFPEEFAVWAEKSGIDREWALRYWAAHWGLPSPNQGFEMLHRGIASEDELKLLLRALDVMPFWREKLIELSYNPITRVDVRRMYKLGVFDETELLKRYRDLGYSPQDAKYMTEFTVKYEGRENDETLGNVQSVTRTLVIRAYKLGVISREEANDRLIQLGFMPADASLILDIEDTSIKLDNRELDIEKARETTIKLVIQSYIKRTMDRDEAIDKLSTMGVDRTYAETLLDIEDTNFNIKLNEIILASVQEQYTTFIITDVRMVEILRQSGFSDNEIARIKQELDLLRESRDRHPPLGDLRKFLNSGIISPQEFMTELMGLGYHDKYVSWYMQLDVGLEN